MLMWGSEVMLVGEINMCGFENWEGGLVDLLVGLARLSVCVEDQINAVGLLDIMSIFGLDEEDIARMQEK
jgi:hypothetical protein